MLYPSKKSFNLKQIQHLKKSPIFVLVFSISFFSGSISAASNDDQVLSYLATQCTGAIPSELASLCLTLFPGGGAGGPPAGSTASLNAITSSAQSSSAASSAQNVRASVQDRVEKIKRCEQSKNNNNPTDKIECEELSDGNKTDELFGKLGVFFTGMYNEKDRKQLRENGFNSSLEGFVGGFDYRFTDWITAGFAVGHTSEDSQFKSAAGDLNAESWNYTLYGTLTPIDNVYLDFSAGYADMDFKSTRNISLSTPSGTISGITNGENSADMYTVGLVAGYSWYWKGLSIDPRVKFDYSVTDIKAYNETGNTDLELSFAEQHRRSLTTSFGTQISYAHSIPWGVVIPQLRSYYVHEYKNSVRTIQNSLSISPAGQFSNLTDDPDRDYMIWGGGISTVLPHGIQLFADFEQLVAHRYLNSWTASGGLRFEF